MGMYGETVIRRLDISAPSGIDVVASTEVTNFGAGFGFNNLVGESENKKNGPFWREFFQQPWLYIGVLVAVAIVLAVIFFCRKFKSNKTDVLDHEAEKNLEFEELPRINAPKPEDKASNHEANAPKPEDKASHPEANAPKPEDKASNHEADAPKPEADAPKPEDKASHPEANAPKPEDKASHPEANAPKPEDKASHPEANAPKPEADAPNPEDKASNPEDKASNPEDKASNPEDKASNPEADAPNPEDKASNPEDKASNPEDKASNPEDKASNPEDKASNPEADAPKPEDKASNPEDKALKEEERKAQERLNQEEEERKEQENLKKADDERQEQENLKKADDERQAQENLKKADDERQAQENLKKAEALKEREAPNAAEVLSMLRRQIIGVDELESEANVAQLLESAMAESIAATKSAAATKNAAATKDIAATKNAAATKDADLQHYNPVAFKNNFAKIKKALGDTGQMMPHIIDFYEKSFSIATAAKGNILGKIAKVDTDIEKIIKNIEQPNTGDESLTLLEEIADLLNECTEQQLEKEVNNYEIELSNAFAFENIAKAFTFKNMEAKMKAQCGDDADDILEYLKSFSLIIDEDQDVNHVDYLDHYIENIEFLLADFEGIMMSHGLSQEMNDLLSNFCNQWKAEVADRMKCDTTNIKSWEALVKACEKEEKFCTRLRNLRTAAEQRLAELCIPASVIDDVMEGKTPLNYCEKIIGVTRDRVTNIKNRLTYSSKCAQELKKDVETKILNLKMKFMEKTFNLVDESQKKDKDEIAKLSEAIQKNSQGVKNAKNIVETLKEKFDRMNKKMQAGCEIEKEEINELKERHKNAVSLYKERINNLSALKIKLNTLIANMARRSAAIERIMLPQLNDAIMSSYRNEDPEEKTKEIVRLASIKQNIESKKEEFKTILPQNQKIYKEEKLINAIKLELKNAETGSKNESELWLSCKMLGYKVECISNEYVTESSLISPYVQSLDQASKVIESKTSAPKGYENFFSALQTFRKNWAQCKQYSTLVSEYSNETENENFEKNFCQLNFDELNTKQDVDIEKLLNYFNDFQNTISKIYEFSFAENIKLFEESFSKLSEITGNKDDLWNFDKQCTRGLMLLGLYRQTAIKNIGEYVIELKRRLIALEDMDEYFKIAENKVTSNADKERLSNYRDKIKTLYDNLTRVFDSTVANIVEHNDFHSAELSTMYDSINKKFDDGVSVINEEICEALRIAETMERAVKDPCVLTLESFLTAEILPAGYDDAMKQIKNIESLSQKPKDESAAADQARNLFVQEFQKNPCLVTHLLVVAYSVFENQKIKAKKIEYEFNTVLSELNNPYTLFGKKEIDEIKTKVENLSEEFLICHSALSTAKENIKLFELTLSGALEQKESYLDQLKQNSEIICRASKMPILGFGSKASKIPDYRREFDILKRKLQSGYHNVQQLAPSQNWDISDLNTLKTEIDEKINKAAAQGITALSCFITEVNVDNIVKICKNIKILQDKYASIFSQFEKISENRDKLLNGDISNTFEEISKNHDRLLNGDIDNKFEKISKNYDKVLNFEEKYAQNSEELSKCLEEMATTFAELTKQGTKLETLKKAYTEHKPIFYFKKDMLPSEFANNIATKLQEFETFNGSGALDVGAIKYVKNSENNAKFSLFESTKLEFFKKLLTCAVRNSEIKKHQDDFNFLEKNLEKNFDQLNKNVLQNLKYESLDFLKILRKFKKINILKQEIESADFKPEKNTKYDAIAEQIEQLCQEIEFTDSEPGENTKHDAILEQIWQLCQEIESADSEPEKNTKYNAIAGQIEQLCAENIAIKQNQEKIKQDQISKIDEEIKKLEEEIIKLNTSDKELIKKVRNKEIKRDGYDKIIAENEQKKNALLAEHEQKKNAISKANLDLTKAREEFARIEALQNPKEEIKTEEAFRKFQSNCCKICKLKQDLLNEEREIREKKIKDKEIKIVKILKSISDKSLKLLPTEGNGEKQSKLQPFERETTSAAALSANIIEAQTRLKKYIADDAILLKIENLLNVKNTLLRHKEELNSMKKSVCPSIAFINKFENERLNPREQIPFYSKKVELENVVKNEKLDILNQIQSHKAARDSLRSFIASSAITHFNNDIHGRAFSNLDVHEREIQSLEDRLSNLEKLKTPIDDADVLSLCDLLGLDAQSSKEYKNLRCQLQAETFDELFKKNEDNKKINNDLLKRHETLNTKLTNLENTLDKSIKNIDRDLYAIEGIVGTEQLMKLCLTEEEIQRYFGLMPPSEIPVTKTK